MTYTIIAALATGLAKIRVTLLALNCWGLVLAMYPIDEINRRILSVRAHFQYLNKPSREKEQLGFT
jgi:hypothetical protein